MKQWEWYKRVLQVLLLTKLQALPVDSPVTTPADTFAHLTFMLYQTFLSWELKLIYWTSFVYSDTIYLLQFERKCPTWFTINKFRLFIYWDLYKKTHYTKLIWFIYLLFMIINVILVKDNTHVVSQEKKYWT